MPGHQLLGQPVAKPGSISSQAIVSVPAAFFVQPSRDRQDKRLLKALQIGLGVEQSVGVVDAQAGHAVAGDEVENQRVSGPEHLLAIGAQRRQRVDVEKTAIVDFVGGDTPVGQPVGLRRESASSASKLRGLPGVPFSSLDAASDGFGITG